MNSTLPLDLMLHLAFAGGFQPEQDFVFDLHVPGIIIFAGLQHRARGRYRVAAALDFQRVEMRPVGDVVVGVALGQHHVARLEIDEHVGAGADRLQIGRRVARFAADVIRKQMFWEDHAVGADKGIGPVRRRLVEEDANGEIVDLFDLDVLVAADRDGRGLRLPRIFPGEDDVVGGERLAVMPFDAALQLPDHRAAVLGEPVIFLARNFGGQHRHQIAVAVPSRQRLVEDPRAFLVLGADGEMRVEQGDRLPIEQLQQRRRRRPWSACTGIAVAAIATPDWLSIMPAIGAVRPTAIIRWTKARRDNWPVFDIRNQVSKFPLFHGCRLLAGAECLVHISARAAGNGSGSAPPCQSRIRASAGSGMRRDAAVVEVRRESLKLQPSFETADFVASSG